MCIVYKQNNYMALAISIEDLLKKQRIKSDRIEFKMGRTIACMLSLMISTILEVGLYWQGHGVTDILI